MKFMLVYYKGGGEAIEGNEEPAIDNYSLIYYHICL